MAGRKQYEVRLAQTDEEREAIYRLRYKIYIEEEKKHHIPADNERKMVYDKADFYSAHYYIRDKHGLISSARVTHGTDGPFLQCDKDFFCIPEFEKHFPHKELAVISRVVADSNIGISYAFNKTLMSVYMGAIMAGVKICFASSDEWLLQKYERFGARIFETSGQVKKSEACHRLVLFLQDYEYLKKIKCPLLPYLNKSSDDGGEYPRKVRELLGYQLSSGITPTSLENRLKKAVCELKALFLSGNGFNSFQ